MLLGAGADTRLFLYCACLIEHKCSYPLGTQCIHKIFRLCRLDKCARIDKLLLNQSWIWLNIPKYFTENYSFFFKIRCLICYPSFYSVISSSSLICKPCSFFTCPKWTIQIFDWFFVIVSSVFRELLLSDANGGNVTAVWTATSCWSPVGIQIWKVCMYLCAVCVRVCVKHPVICGLWSIPEWAACVGV